MRNYPTPSDYLPLRYFGRVPVYVSTILTALLVAGMLITTMIATAHGPVDALVFSPDAFFRHGKLWQLLTCTFVNAPNFFFLFGIFCFYRFSVDVEQYLGRKRFLMLYGLMLATPVLVAGGWYLGGVNMAYEGMYDLLVGMFIAFATLYPNLEYFGWVPVKYVAFACMAIAALEYFPNRDWPGLTLMLAMCGVGVGYVRHLQRGAAVDLGGLWRKLNPFRRRPKFRVLPSTGTPARSSGSASIESVDAILDKIAKSGFASLTPQERAQLESAREALLKRRS